MRQATTMCKCGFLVLSWFFFWQSPLLGQGTWCDFDDPCSPYIPTQFGVGPPPTIEPGGPTGNFLRLVTTTVVNVNTITFDLTDPVIKRLDEVVGSPPGIAGSTVLGDGRIVMILDPTALTALPPSAGRLTGSVN